MFFITRIQRAMRSTTPSTSWMRRQNERLWCMVPFWDSVGVALINECKAKDLRIICRPSVRCVTDAFRWETAKYLSSGVQVRFDPDGHSKVIVGDTATLLGSFNMTYQSMFDNQENATYSRSTDYADFFLAEWEEAVVPSENAKTTLTNE
jgi:hypothetical protein